MKVPAESSPTSPTSPGCSGWAPRYRVECCFWVCLWGCFCMRPALEWGPSAAVCPPHCGRHPLPRGSEQNKAEGGRVCLLMARLGCGAPALRPGLTPLAFLFSGLHTRTEPNTGPSGAPICRGQITGILSLHNHMSQSLLHNKSVYRSIYLSMYYLSIICPSIHSPVYLSITLLSTIFLCIVYPSLSNL